MALPLDSTVVTYETLPALAVTSAGATLTLTEAQLHELQRIRMRNLGPNPVDFAAATAGSALTVGQNDELLVDEAVVERVRVRTWGFRTALGQTATIAIAVEGHPTL